ncbi:hypothetical protein ACFRNJ_22025 [Streptomyces sp. NPDC056721]
MADNTHYSHPDPDARLAGEQQLRLRLRLPAKYRVDILMARHP